MSDLKVRPPKEEHPASTETQFLQGLKPQNICSVMSHLKVRGGKRESLEPLFREALKASLPGLEVRGFHLSRPG
jgi:hypothetical protein